MKRSWSCRRSTPFLRARLLYFSLFIYARGVVGAFTSEPRWGQAVSVVNNLLYVSGGKTDQYGSYSYTSAPTTNDLFTLDLSKSFNPSSPPWDYISGSQDASTPQGQQLAWHALAAYNTSQLLLFGGDGGPNSPIVLPSQANSAQLLDVSGPTWISEEEGWANEPSRRIHHTTTTIGGKVYLVGGERDDGSTFGYSDHYVFDPSSPSFTLLPTQNGPPDIYGHGSVGLSDGRLLVFGGYSQSEGTLMPFTTVWSLDTTQSSLAWTTENVSGSNVPSGRRAFACTWIEDDKVLIHGGSDADFQTSYSDGWILDTTTNPMTWTNVSVLSQVGARRDHFAVQVGTQVVFGFGYGTNAGASVALSVYNYDQGSFTSSFSPQSGPSFTTIPSPSGTGGSSSGGSDGSGSGGSNGSGSTHGSGSNGSNGSGDPSDPSSSGSNGGSGGEDDKKDIAVIIIASIFGFLAAAIAVGYLIFVILRRRRMRNQFYRLNNEDERRPPQKAPWELAGIAILPWFRTRRALARGEKTRVADKKEGWTVLGLGHPRERIDMLANEDASELGVGGRYERRPRHTGSGDSRSWYSTHDVESGSQIGRLVSDSLKSLRNIGSGVRRVISGGSASGSHGRQWTDISLTVDPHDDSEGLLSHDFDKSHTSTNGLEEEDIVFALAARPRGGGERQEGSYASRYSDPFQDRDEEEREVLFDASVNGSKSMDSPSADPSSSLALVTGSTQKQDEQDGVRARSSHSTVSHSSNVIGPQLPPLVTTSSRSTTTNNPSSSSLLDGGGSVAGHSSSSSSHRATALSITSSVTSRPRTTSIIGLASPSSSQLSSPVKRSDSWWARFRRPRASSFRGESLTEQRRQGSLGRLDLDFRDPNPPPGRLGAIKEASGGSASAGDSLRASRIAESAHEKKTSGSGSGSGLAALDRLYMTNGGPEQSTTSLKTSRTADSAALERMAGRVDVAFREATGGSSIDYASSLAESQRRGSHDHEREGTWSTLGGSGHGLQRSESPERSLDIADEDRKAMLGEADRLVEQAPTDTTDSSFERDRRGGLARPVLHYHSLSTPTPIPAPAFSSSSSSSYKGKSPVSPGTVAARIADYERRMSLEFPPSSPSSFSASTPTTPFTSVSSASPARTSSTPTPKPPGKRRKTSNVKYGLVQRPELFVANPDRDRHSVSSSLDT